MKSAALMTALLLTAACAGVPSLPAESSRGDTVEIMVLGSYHMDNPGADVVNTKIDDVLAPARQAELAALTRRLAAFQPTAIMVETQSPRDDLLDEGYLSFDPASLNTDRNEIVQIAYRLAHEMGLTRVYGIDTQDGEIDFFPFGEVQAFEEAKGDTSLTETLIAQVQSMSTAFEAAQETESVSGLLALENDPAEITSMHNEFYYGLLELADGKSQPGAQLNYGWYARNALTFAKIAAVTEPGDRVLVLFGSGHAYWLRHFAENVPGYTLAESLPYLEN